MTSDWHLKIYARMVQDAVEDLTETASGNFDYGKSLCQSPIEIAMAAALYRDLLYEYAKYTIEIEFRRSLGTEWPDGNHYDAIILFPQAEVGCYKLDLLLHYRLSKWMGWIGIECDGHDFHEKTKDQARHDKSRDRSLSIKGITMLRFTGAEIFDDVEACSQQVLDMMASKIRASGS